MFLKNTKTSWEFETPNLGINVTVSLLGVTILKCTFTSCLKLMTSNERQEIKVLDEHFISVKSMNFGQNVSFNEILSLFMLDVSSTFFSISFPFFLTSGELCVEWDDEKHETNQTINQ